MGFDHSCILCGAVVSRDHFRAELPAWLSDYSIIVFSPAKRPCLQPADGDSALIKTAPRFCEVVPGRNIEEDPPVMNQCTDADDELHGFVLHSLCAKVLSQIPLRRLVQTCMSLPLPGELDPFPDQLDALCDEHEDHWSDFSQPPFMAGIMSTLEWPHRYGSLFKPETTERYPWQGAFCRTSFQAAEHAEVEPIKRGMTGSTKRTNANWKRIQALVPRIEHLIAGQLYIPQAPPTSSLSRGESPSFGDNSPSSWLAQVASIVFSFLKAVVTYFWRHQAIVTSLRVNGEIQNSSQKRWYSYEQGCYSLIKVTCALPHPVERTYVSTITLEMSSTTSITFVTGLRFIGSNGTCVSIGYIRGEETAFDHGFQGFRIAASSKGIQALQIKGKNGEESSWAGNPHSVPQSDQLAALDSDHLLTVELDGFKIVGLGVENTGTPVQMALRAAALWYPEIPPLHLNLNERSYTGPHPLGHTAYRPLAWITFGGENGKDLRTVRALAVRSSSQRIHSIHILHCDLGDVNNLGRGDESLGLLWEAFEIHGMGRERITSVSAYIQDIPATSTHLEPDIVKYGMLKAIKVRTSKGREFKSSLASHTTGMRLMQLTTESDATITGFYASLDKNFGLIHLGVISEHL